VQAEVEKRLELMKVGEWKEYAGSKASTLASSLEDMLRELQGTWSFICDRCGRRLAVELSLSDIGSLLRGETVDITCATCLDPARFPFLLSTVHIPNKSDKRGCVLDLTIASNDTFEDAFPRFSHKT